MAALESGTLLGSYEILVSIGAGGMGEVYRARDTRLKRDVAIKSLPSAFAQDPDRVARFQREAQVLASLNHPNIAAIYDVQELHGSQFLVMELVEGETLGERLVRGPLRIDEALELAKQIALALEAAHEKGILHRDLKPANIKVTPDGRVKVLDFGLAKLLEPSSGEGTGLSNSPTMLMSGTLGGAILGTAGYMSPEQARGQPVDRTSDVWAFGCVLYEMLSGRQAFDGESVSDILGSVLKVEPDWNALPAGTPPDLCKLLRRCLQKDRKRRLRDVADARIEIEEMGLESSVPPRRGPRSAWVLAASGFLVVIALSFALYPRPSEEPRTVEFQILPPEGAAFASGIGGTESWASPAFSPDGRSLAFTARDASQKVLLWIRPMDTSAPRSYPGTEDAGGSFWSPDSLSVGFFAQGKLKKVDIASGLVQELAEVQLTPRGGTWNREGVILFAPSPGDSIYRISSVPGSKPMKATEFAKGQTSHRSPTFLPDGRHFLYYALGSAEVAGLYVGSLDSTDSKRLDVNTDSGALYSPSGHLLFLRQGILLRQPFNVSTLEVAGDPVSVAEQVASFGNLISFTVSDKGDLAYWSLERAREHSQLMWVDRSGKPIAALGPPGNYMGIDLSRDGKVLVHRHEAGVGNIVMFEGSNRPMKMLTNEASQHNSNPVLSADGTQFIFQSLRDSKWGIYSKRLDGIGDVKPLYSSEYISAPLAWSRDGKFIIFWSFKAGSTDLWILDTTGEKEPELFARSASFAQFSPIGDWVAYSSETDGRNEVYIRRPTSTEGMQQISIGGGGSPRWRQDGKELFYYATGRRKLVSVKVNALGPVIDYDPPIDLFDIESAVGDNSGPAHWYAVSPDGQQFLVVRTPAGASPIIAIQNWTASLD